MKRADASTHVRVPAEVRSGRNLALMLFFVNSLTVAMSITQDATPEVGSLAYWLLVLPSLLLPLCDSISIARNLLSRAWPLLAFGLIAGMWHMLAGDYRAAMQLALMVWGLAWLGCSRAQMADRHLVWLYVALVVIGACVWLTTGLNKWGLLPYTTLAEYAEGGWRLSFYPNIANSAILSLGLFFVLTRDREVMRRFWPVLLLATYFVLFSFVRTALIGLVLYLFTRWWLHRKPRSSRAMFWMALLLGVGINLMIALSTPVFGMLQEIDLVARLFLRNEVGMSNEAIYVQIYRPWLWMQHVQLFWGSPGLMGLGVFDFSQVLLDELIVGTTPAGNEAVLTRLLATYGLPAVLFVYYLIRCLRDLARRQDAWACACFPTIILLMMQWGNIFHPTDANGALFMLMVTQGARALGGRAVGPGRGADSFRSMK